MPFLKDHQFRSPEDDADEKLIEDVKSSGFHIIEISEDGGLENLEYAFTVGCYYSYGIPEIVLFGMKYEMARSLMWNYVDWAKNGMEVASGMVTDQLANIPLKFRKVDISWHRELLGYGIWFYRDLAQPFPCMQLTWPDPAG